MTKCEKCAHDNVDNATFCDSCGHFLKFTSPGPSRPPEGGEAPEPPEEPPLVEEPSLVEEPPPAVHQNLPSAEELVTPDEPANAGALVDRSAIDPTPPEPQTVYSTERASAAVLSPGAGEERPAIQNIEQRRRVQQRQDRDEEKQRQAAYRRQRLRAPAISSARRVVPATTLTGSSVGSTQPRSTRPR